MLSYIVGTVDVNSALVLCVLSITICIIVTTMVAKRRSRLNIEHDFALAKMKQQAQHDEAMAGISNKREFNMKQIEAGLITSHRSED